MTNAAAHCLELHVNLRQHDRLRSAPIVNLNVFYQWQYHCLQSFCIFLHRRVLELGESCFKSLHGIDHISNNIAVFDEVIESIVKQTPGQRKSMRARIRGERGDEYQQEWPRYIRRDGKLSHLSLRGPLKGDKWILQKSRCKHSPWQSDRI
jgi:hypothetical protein